MLQHLLDDLAGLMHSLEHREYPLHMFFVVLAELQQQSNLVGVYTLKLPGKLSHFLEVVTRLLSPLKHIDELLIFDKSTYLCLC